MITTTFTEVGEFVEFSSSIVKTLRLPSGYVKKAIENGPVEIVDFPMNSMVIFQFANCKRLPALAKLANITPITWNNLGLW